MEFDWQQMIVLAGLCAFCWFFGWIKGWSDGRHSRMTPDEIKREQDELDHDMSIW